MEEFLNELNGSQREAVLYTDGPSLVIAGAGSGKTRVLTYKIAYLLSRGWAPYNILSLTFTNKAAREMKERISQLAEPGKVRQLWMGTFHSVFSRILRKEAACLGYSPEFTIYDSDDSKSLIKSIIKEMALDDKAYRPGLVQGRISQAKNALVTPESYARNKELMEEDIRRKVPHIRDIYARYRSRCFQAGAMDFDDLLLQTNILFRDFPDILERYGNQFRYILVDEYQDTNFAQYLIVQRLAQKHGCLCVVGDDAQSIYSFRGANIDNILQFKNQYESCKVFKLERNYRSTQNIVNVANSLISKNNNQIHKNIYSEKESGNKIKLITSYSDYEEAHLISSKIMDIQMENKGAYSFRDFAVLYRTNAQSRVLEEAFRKRNIPYRVYGGFSFYQRKEIKDVLAYLRLIVNPNDEEALKRIINYPVRGIGDTTVNRLIAAAHTHNTSVWKVIQDPKQYEAPLQAAALKKVEAFRLMMENFMEQQAVTAIDGITSLVIHGSGMANEFLQDRTVENISRMENLQELIKGMADFVNTRLEEGSTQAGLPDFLAEAALYTDQDNDRQDGEKVLMMTVHASKGLEFKNVLVAGLEEELFPSSMSGNDPRAIEEERRLFYVAITRAEENCVLTYAKNRFRNGTSNTCRPSRFLFDLDEELLDFVGGGLHGPSSRVEEPPYPQRYGTFGTYGTSGAPRRTEAPKATPVRRDGSFVTLSKSELSEGMDVMHERFGAGRIIALEGEGSNASAIIEFESLGTKRLILKYAYLKIL
ncbi:DNA helicase [Bacteroidia bacterium]|nr:DNA helicase [Bacteroidia bacterium]